MASMQAEREEAQGACQTMFKTIRDTFTGLAHHGEKPSADKAAKQHPDEVRKQRQDVAT